MIQQAVIDTNVVVSGVLAGGAASPLGRIVDAMLGGRLRFVLSEVLLAEYRRVLLRPAIVARHGLSEAEVDRFLEDLVVNATLTEPPTGDEGDPPVWGAAPIVPGDERVLALLRAVPDAVLVTGDRRLRQAAEAWCSVDTPAEFALRALSTQDRPTEDG